MEIFLYYKIDEKEYILDRHQAISYEYNSKSDYNSKEYFVEIILNVEILKEDEIKDIRKWAYSKNDENDENYYNYFSFGIMTKDSIIKQIIFPNAYIYDFKEDFDFTKNENNITINIKQKDDIALKYLEILPIVISNVYDKTTELLQDSALQYEEEEDTQEDFALQYDDEEENTQNIILFKEKLSKQVGMTDEYNEILAKRFATGSREAQEIFLRVVPENSVKDHTRNDEYSYYHLVERRIFMDFECDSTVEDYPGKLYFHEHGHLIDVVERSGESVGNRFCRDAKFENCLKNDFNNYVENYMATNNLSRDEAYDQIANLLKEPACDTVLDLFSALSDGKCTGEAAHYEEYFRDNPVWREEAAAHFWQAHFYKEYQDIIGKFFPTSLQRFNVLLKKEHRNPMTVYTTHF